MSHYTKVRIKATNQDNLVKALEDLGFANKVQVHKQAQQLEGYKGDKRQQTAEIIIPRKYVGTASNDIGFKLQQDGTYEAIISEYDKNKYNQRWLNKLSQQYAYNQIKEDLDLGGFFIQAEEEVNGEIHLTCTSYG